MDPENTTIGRRLRQERQRLGLTQSALAKVAGVSKASQLSYEADATDPGADYLINIAAAGVDVHWVLMGESLQQAGWRRLDTRLLVAITLAIEQWAATRGKPTSLETRDDLLRLIYEHCSRDGVLDMSFVQKALKVAG